MQEQHRLRNRQLEIFMLMAGDVLRFFDDTQYKKTRKRLEYNTEMLCSTGYVSDAVYTASDTTSEASSSGSNRPPKALSIGGSSGARRRTAGKPRNAQAAAANAMVTQLRNFMVEEVERVKADAAAAAALHAHENKAAEELHAHEKKVAAALRAHELNLVKAEAKANAPKTVEQQLVELKGLLEKGLVTQEHHDKLKMKCLETGF